MYCFLHALNDAVKTIILGGADRILVVGARSAVCGAGVGGFAAIEKHYQQEMMI